MSWGWVLYAPGNQLGNSCFTIPIPVPFKGSDHLPSFFCCKRVNVACKHSAPTFSASIYLNQQKMGPWKRRRDPIVKKTHPKLDFWIGIFLRINSDGGHFLNEFQNWMWHQPYTTRFNKDVWVRGCALPHHICCTSCMQWMNCLELHSWCCTHLVLTDFVLNCCRWKRLRKLIYTLIF